MRLLLVLVAVFLAGCYQNGPPPADTGGGQFVPPPPPQYTHDDDGEVILDEDKWFSNGFGTPAAGSVHVDVAVTDGIAVDIYVMDDVNKQSYESDGSFLYIRNCSEEGVKRHVGSCNVDDGDWWLIVDNTNRGETRPPTNGVNDRARVSWSWSYASH